MIPTEGKTHILNHYKTAAKPLKNISSYKLQHLIDIANKLNKDVEEYWYMDEIMYYMTEREENNRLQLGLRVSPLDWPLPEKRCFRFWNTEEPTWVHEVTQARDHWSVYQYHDGCYIYPTNMTTFFRNK